jgi:peptidoglycan/LPS O-acetylase OafA/YrhL
MTIASRLGSILDPDKNSLKLVRLLAALSVIISHAFEIAIARGAPQLLEGTTPFNLGQHAVNAFFIVSGLTLSQALVRSPDLMRNFLARALRIFPPLFVYGFVLAFVAGPVLTCVDWRDYWSLSDTLLYPLRVSVCAGAAFSAI